jgi:O-acetyl-ADP-ribose deacetylase (regulator of RNase III)
MGKINYVIGDATAPQGDGNKIITHICNNIGAWGAGFVLAISRRWRAPEIAYRFNKKWDLGTVDLIRVENDIIVANMVAQEGIMDKHTKGVIDADAQPAIRYAAVRECLKIVNDQAFMTNSTIHMPRIGCGLAGGKWEEIEKIINEVVTVDVYVYDLK